MHKHTLESTDKEGKTLREEYDYVPAEVLGSAGYHAEPDWCGPRPCPRSLACH